MGKLQRKHKDFPYLLLLMPFILIMGFMLLVILPAIMDALKKVE
jgi:hypothetical protein